MVRKSLDIKKLPCYIAGRSMERPYRITRYIIKERERATRLMAGPEALPLVNRGRVARGEPYLRKQPRKGCPAGL